MNIGPNECYKRAVIGGVMLFLGVGLGMWLGTSSLNRWWRLLVFVPLWIATLGLQEGREKL